MPHSQNSVETEFKSRHWVSMTRKGCLGRFLPDTELKGVMDMIQVREGGRAHIGRPGIGHRVSQSVRRHDGGARAVLMVWYGVACAVVGVRQSQQTMHESFEEWLRATTTLSADTEVRR